MFAATPEVQAAEVRARTPVVLIALDEISTVALMDGRQRIDARRFPNFGALARDATWYRNATTEYWLTEGAVPSLMTGRTPKPKLLPVYSHYPQNIFTLLGKGYRMRVVESLSTSVRASSAATSGPAARGPCRHRDSLVSDVGIVYLHLVVPEPYDERRARRQRLVGKLRPAEHAEEAPRRGARRSRAGGTCATSPTSSTLPPADALPPPLPPPPRPTSTSRPAGATRSTHRSCTGCDGRWRDRVARARSYQRYLLQLGYTDRALGLIMRRLRETGVYDRALVIVTADHGVSFRLGEPRRLPPARNLDDIAFVPLFVKLPGPEAGPDRRLLGADDRHRADDRPRARDPPRWRLDGRPLGGGSAQPTRRSA